jgi:hypothetical protein
MYLANGSPAELLSLRGRAYHLATAGKDDLVAELNRRGYAVAVITPQELIKAIEGAEVPVPAEFDSSEWMAQYRATLEKVMGKAAVQMVIAQLEADRPKGG